MSENYSVRGEIARLDTMSPDDIASYLLKHGIKGKPGNDRDCAIARYLNSRGLDISSLRVGGVMAWRTKDERPQLMVTPPSIVGFIQNFDREKYSALIDA